MGAAAPLVGRATELAVLHAELERARAGELRCVLLLGEAGIGKTRPAREILTTDGVTALSARAYPLGEGAAFGLLAPAPRPARSCRHRAHL